MNNKTMFKSELIYLLEERNVKAKMVNNAIRDIENCDTYAEMLSVYNYYDRITK